jgi:hypothetical protein
MDRRQHNRFALKGSVSFFRQELDGVRSEGNGFTRDISERGLFVLTDAQVPLGEAVRLEIVFYSPGTNSVMRMTAKGQVLRAEPGCRGEHMGGFAAAISSVAFRNGMADSGTQVAQSTPAATQPC